MIDVPFIYTTLHAFYLVLQYDDRRNIEIDDLFNYRDKILENVLDNYYNDPNPYYKSQDVWEGEVDFEEVNKEEELNCILKNYPELFSLDNNKIYIEPDVDIRKIRQLLNEYEMPHSRFDKAAYSKEILKLLNIHKIYEDNIKYKKFGYELEKKIEQAYNENSSEKKLKLLLYKRFIFTFNVALNNKVFVENFDDIPNDEDKEIVIDENYDYYINSEYIKNGEKYPIDKELYENSDFYEDLMDEFNPIQQNIEDVYQYGIFGEGPLYDRKYDNTFTQLRMATIFGSKEDPDDSLDEFDLSFDDDIDLDDENRYACLNFDIEEEEFVFYITYIKKLNDLIDQGRTDLVSVRNRILYLLDDIKYCLFKKENVDKFYDQSANYKLEEDSFEFFANEAKYFIEDVFEGKAGKTIEKLLFTATYYKITKDEEVVDLLSEYKDDERYQNYSEIILGKNKGYSKTKRK